MCRPSWATARTCRDSTTGSSTWSSPRTCSNTSIARSTDLLLAESARVLRAGGSLILLQPNFRLNPGGYFDDYTHVAIYTDRSLADYLTSRGWTVTQKYARFLPLTMNSKGSALTFLVPWYLRSPVKPLAGQMLLIATPGATAADR